MTAGARVRGPLCAGGEKAGTSCAGVPRRDVHVDEPRGRRALDAMVAITVAGSRLTAVEDQRGG